MCMGEEIGELQMNCGFKWREGIEGYFFLTSRIT